LSSSNTIAYGAYRGDWIQGADLVSRLIVRASRDGLVLSGFPRQWIPIFVLFGVKWKTATAPRSYVPLASDLSESALTRISKHAQRAGNLRGLVEAFVVSDPLLADVLYILDRRIEARSTGGGSLTLTGWQSYGRPEVLRFNKLVESEARTKHETAVLLPCARARPYGRSKTHKRIWRGLAEQGYGPTHIDRVVVSSIGVVPESLWEHPVVLAYDSGVPDIYRVLRLMRVFFSKARYATVVDCLEFQPYSDCLAIVAREGLIRKVCVGRQSRSKRLPRP
jgi:predicted RNA-binding protein